MHWPHAFDYQQMIGQIHSEKVHKAAQKGKHKQNPQPIHLTSLAHGMNREKHCDNHVNADTKNRIMQLGII
ncbi:hypothetical protein GCM10009007_12310 [Formosimonas limnophila]|uniref:Uncharacterized protein n=1 Tax=Formosimonas limnophila TaxID=1384487 RepID=A0A8J3G0E4_9BURK|nr:hypothetical protein GCM10009007_12310 [Formosimonas limnophila]